MSRAFLFLALCFLVILVPTLAARSRHSLRTVAADAHVVCNVTVASGSWTGVLSVLYERVSFTDSLGSSIQSFPVSSAMPFSFGVVLDDSDDFDVTFQLSMIEEGKATALSRRMCLFVISAFSAGHPQVMPVVFNGQGMNCTHANAGYWQMFNVGTGK
jgi:hypothetical protein